ncbi:MAG: hypothetical protein JW719_04465 [Pirellulales bacterium]|nr:hypothetical protein [Pirellulales bacterium]
MQISTVSRVAVAVVLAGIWLACGAGCASFNVSSVAEVFDKEGPIAAPANLAVVWTTTVLEKPGAQTTRGFGGIVTFYGADQTKPVRVHGSLSVYAYNDLSPKTDDSTPDRKYVFTPEQLDKHFGKGPTGASYHIWIPWDEAGGPRQEIGLIVRFDPEEGKPVIGKPTHTVLPGPKDERDRLWASRSNLTPVSPQPIASGGQTPGAAEPSSTPASRVEVTTLNLPSRGMAIRASSTPATAPMPGEKPSAPTATPNP